MDAIVFDFDGLLFDSETPIYNAAAKLCRDHGAELDRHWWTTEVIGSTHAAGGHWSQRVAERIGRPLGDPEALRATLEAENRRHFEAAGLQPGALELLDAAAAAGVPCAVASSSRHEWVDGHLGRLGVLDRFAAVRCRDDVPPGRGKPHPDLYLAACAALEARPSRSVALEDTINGCRAARAAGMKVMGVADGVTAGLDLGGDDQVPLLTEVTLGRLRALLGA
jgi:HAD superfamily hydrolase (TIGR01509 family)